MTPKQWGQSSFMSVKCEDRHITQSGSQFMRFSWARQGLKRIIHDTMTLSSIILSVMIEQRTKSWDMLLRLCAKVKDDIWGLFNLCIMRGLWHEACINRETVCTETCLKYEGIMKKIWGFAQKTDVSELIRQTVDLILRQIIILHSVFIALHLLLWQLH